MLSACVTINVYFPAAAAEKAADKIIEDVWGPATSRADATKRDDKSGRCSNGGQQRVLLAAAASALELLIPSRGAGAGGSQHRNAGGASTDAVDGRRGTRN